jgi:hypothetical protein
MAIDNIARGIALMAKVANVNTAARNLANGYVLGQSAVQVSHTGDLNETVLATITIPAGAIGANGRVEVKTRWSRTNGGSPGLITTRAKLGGTSLFAPNVATTVTNFRFDLEIANRNSQASQFTSAVSFTSNGVNGGQINGTATVDTSTNADITITGQLTNAGDTITLESYQVILYPHG